MRVFLLFRDSDSAVAIRPDQGDHQKESFENRQHAVAATRVVLEIVAS